MEPIEHRYSKGYGEERQELLFRLFEGEGLTVFRKGNQVSLEITDHMARLGQWCNLLVDKRISNIDQVRVRVIIEVANNECFAEKADEQRVK